MAFLATRIKEPVEDDWGKLLRLMTYLNDTKELVLKLIADGMNILGWFVDASYATQAEMKSHMVSVVTMGKGSIKIGEAKTEHNKQHRSRTSWF